MDTLTSSEIQPKVELKDTIKTEYVDETYEEYKTPSSNFLRVDIKCEGENEMDYKPFDLPYPHLKPENLSIDEVLIKDDLEAVKKG